MRLIDVDLIYQETMRYSEKTRSLILKVVNALPPIDIVRCKECKHRVVNEHYGEKGYLNIKAYCDLDTGDIFELGRRADVDEWFCADGEREGE